MEMLVRTSRTLPEIRLKALALTRMIGSKNFYGEICALRDYCYRDIQYRKDIRGVETLQTPIFTMRYGQGDCDDKSILFAALAQSVGHNTRFRAVATRGENYCHVLPEVSVRMPGKRREEWIPVELTEPFEVGYFPATSANMYS